MARYRFSILFGTFLLFLVSFPLLTHYGMPWLHVLLSATTTLVLLSGIFAASDRPRSFWIASIVIFPAIALNWLETLFPEWHLPLAGELLQLAALIYITAVLLAYALRRGRVDGEKIAAAVSAYLLIGLIWRDLYLLVNFLIPGSFNTETLTVTSFLYFSYITLSTLGYGDILPANGPAQALAFTEAIVGQLYLAILVARLVGLHIAYADLGSTPSRPSHQAPRCHNGDPRPAAPDKRH
jgi:hypothetical protein